MDSKEILVQLLRLTYRLSSIQDMLKELHGLTRFSRDVQTRFSAIINIEIGIVGVSLNDIIEELQSDVEKAESLAESLKKGV